MDHDPNQSAPPSDRSGDQLVADRLADQAARLDIGTPMVEVVIQRGRQRQQRRRTAVGVLSVAGVCAAAIVTVNVLSRPADHGAVGMAPSDTVPADGLVTTPLNLVESDMVWSRVDPDSAEALSILSVVPGATVAGDGPFLAWSTAPGQATDEFVPALWRSDDGISWEQVAEAPSMNATNIASRDGQFFAYGTSPTTTASINGRTFDPALLVSDDGGVTWNDLDLPLDTSALASEPGVNSVSVVPASIAAGPTGVLAAARVSAIIDWESILPPEVYRANWNPTETGITYGDSRPCDSIPGTCTEPSYAPTTIVGVSDGTPLGSIAPENTIMPMGPETTLTWAELGISERAVDAWRNGDRELFFSTDGETFVPVAESIGLPDDWQSMQIVDVDDGFVAAVGTYDEAAGASSSRLFSTTDGTSWTDLGPSPLGYADNFVSVDGRLVMSGQLQDGNTAFRSTAAVAVSNPDGTWTVGKLDDLALPTDGAKTSFSNAALAVGPSGITVTATQYVDAVAEAGGVELTQDGITMRAEDSYGEFSFVDAASGDVLANTAGRIPSTSLVRLDEQSGTYQVRAEEGGDIVTTFDIEAMYTRINDASLALGPPPAYVFHTIDGVNWSREALADLAGEPVGSYAGVRQADGQVLVAVNLPHDPTSDEPFHQVVLIGTPKG